MKIGIVREIHPEERRVAASPHTVTELRKQGFDVLVESGAGTRATFSDEAYEAAGATVIGKDGPYRSGGAEVWRAADIIMKVRPPAPLPDGGHEADALSEGKVLISFVFPGQNEDLVKRLQTSNATVLAMDCIPRISRAQKLDALSSMANIAGYRAVVEASHEYGSFFTGQFTAAGKVPPAKVLIIGAGVAGLAAIAAAKALGAIVRAFDTRAAVKDQVESLGGEFLLLQFEESGEGGGGYAKVMSKEFIDAEMALFREQAKDVNIVITTALIPGKKAPILWTKDMVESMQPGSVIVDLAAEQGGNCECTQPGKMIDHNGVTIIGYRDMASRMATVSSDMYGTNVTHLLDEMGRAEGFTVDHDNEVVRGALVLEKGEVMWPAPVVEKKPAPKPKPIEQAPAAPAASTPTSKAKTGGSAWTGIASLGALAIVGLWIYLRTTAGTEMVGETTINLLQRLTVFTLACFVGWQVVWNVSAALHTPLMSVTNAVSGIIIIGGLLGSHGSANSAPVIISGLAALFATINIVGGFMVTQRMLKMFHR